MAKDLAVLLLHGMGSQKEDFAEGIIDELKRRIVGSERIAWQPIYWAEALTEQQAKFLDGAKKNNKLNWMFLREFVVHYLGDPTAYRWVGAHPETVYVRIHRIVRDAIKELYEKGLDRDPKPLIVLGHSLGAHIISNYIWDIQNNQAIVAPGPNPFERIETLRAMITFGCNIPLFTFALSDVVPIRLPSGAQWFNYYDPDDVLSYPLKPISPGYHETVTEDIAVNVGNLLTSWNPFSHTGYWTDDDFTIPVAQFIARLLQ
jgi:predicted esterase